MLTDSHAHLDASDFAQDLDNVMERSRQAGVGLIVTASIDLASCQVSLGLAQRYPEVVAAVGFHPHEAAKIKRDDPAILAELARRPKVVALGEMGLDFHRNLSPREKQRDVFRWQLELARELDLPVVVHSRLAHRETLELLRQVAVTKGIVHCFSGDAALALEYMEMGFLISLSGTVTYRSSRQQLEMVKSLPADKFLVETDCPFLSPEPYRSRRNEPGYLPATVARVAEIRSESVETVADNTSQNACRLFGLPIP